MKKLISLLLVIFAIYGCSPLVVNRRIDDLYYSKPYDPYFFYRNNLLLYNRYSPYNPYYYQPRIYIAPRVQSYPRIMDVRPYKQQPQQKSNAPIRKFK